MSELSREELHKKNVRELASLISSINDFPLKEFVRYVLSTSGLRSEFLNSPGSTAKHHSYYGGLASHSIGAARLGIKVAQHYRELGMSINTGLVIAGLLLHDIGKVFCYIDDNRYCSRRIQVMDGWTCGCKEKRNFHYTNKSSLYHHIPLGAIELSKLVDKFNSSRERSDHCLTEKKADKLIHIVLSHHGRKAWSSPVIPQFTEAYIVHVIEMMDSYVDKYNRGAKVYDLYDH